MSRHISSKLTKRHSKKENESSYEHSLAPGQLYLKNNYLKLVTSRNISWKKFSLIPGDILCDPDKVCDIVDVDNELSMCKDAYLELVARSS